MKIILKRKNSSNSYDVIFEHPGSALLLALFLIDDVGIDIESYIKEFTTGADAAGAMNATQYSKDGDTVIFTYEFTDQSESIAKGHYFLIKTSVLVQLLTLWKDVYKKQPSYIIIKIENDIPVVAGCDELQNVL